MPWQTIASRLELQYPKDNQGRSAVLSPVADATMGINAHDQVAKVGAVMMGIVGLVLLIACVNLANLMLAQTARREKEMCSARRAGRRLPPVGSPVTHRELSAFHGGRCRRIAGWILGPVCTVVLSAMRSCSNPTSRCRSMGACWHSRLAFPF